MSATHDLPHADFPIRSGLTLWFGAALLAWIVSRTYGHLSGELTWWPFFLSVLPAQYMLCVCIHDAVHGVLFPNRVVNTAAGVLMAMGVGLPFPLLRRTHLRHHDTLHEHDDPERVVYELEPRNLLIRLPTIPLIYLRNWRLLTRSERALTLGVVAALGALLALTSARFGAPLAARALLIPALTTIAWFGFTTVYVPHSRHSAALMRYFTEHSGWHHDHHRSPQYPFNQYLQLRHFHLIHGVFAPRGREASIVGWLARRLERHEGPRS